MNLKKITSCTGVIQTVMPSASICGAHTILLQTEKNSPYLHLTPQTYVVDCVSLRPGMRITVFHNITPLPPEQHSAYPAILAAISTEKEHVTLNRFNQDLTAQDGSLHLNISPQTDIQTANGQRFTCHPGNHLLLVYYSITTKSLPPETSPHRIIVL